MCVYLCIYNFEYSFIVGPRECTDSGYKTLENRYKPLFFKDLSKVFKCFKGFSASNTIFIDDEPYKALRNPVKHSNLYYSVVYR